jgi:CheY-like chemotaxis protein
MEVDCAVDGADALEKIRSTRFALVVLDWNMPRLDGGKVLRAMRQAGVHTPVVVVTGRYREEIQLDLESMAAAFVNKNELNPTSLGSAIAASIQLQAV